MGKIRGRFYLKKTSNGNLVGEFSNDYGLYTESADWEDGCNINKFEGTYHSSWREDKKSCYAVLKIDKPNAGINYNLTWIVPKNNTKYKGTGMLCDGMLAGDYESV